MDATGWLSTVTGKVESERSASAVCVERVSRASAGSGEARSD